MAYIKLNSTEITSLQSLGGSFFESLNKSFEKYGQLTEGQYKCLVRTMEKGDMMKGANTEFPNIEPKQQLVISGTVLKVETVTYKKTVQRNWQWEEVENSFDVLYVKGGNKFVFSIPMSFKNMKQIGTKLVAGAPISLKAKFKKIYKDMIAVNYATEFSF